jgi:hypothetical protein
MAGVNQSQQYFSCLVALSRDTGLIGNVLRNYPQEFLRAADKWAEQNADYQEKHEDPNRLPLPDPWQFLLDAHVHERDKAVFRAAQSQLPALRLLCRMARSAATLNKDWHQKSINARVRGDELGYNDAMSKIADAHVWNEFVQADVRKENNPELLEQLEYLQKKRRAQLVRHSKKDEIEQLKKWPSWKELREKNRLPVILVEWWVRCEVNGAPGLMFMRNEALTKFLKFHLNQHLNPLGVKKTRQKLGLIPVGNSEHFVWDISFKRKIEKKLEIKGSRRNGEQSFWGEVSSAKNISPAFFLSVI